MLCIGFLQVYIWYRFHIVYQTYYTFNHIYDTGSAFSIELINKLNYNVYRSFYYIYMGDSIYDDQ